MPRIARQQSITGIYHIMLRGANQQEIFHDDEDNIRFLETIVRYKIQCQIKVYGWCLMDNHVHLLLGKGNEDLSCTMKRICVSYVWYYNLKYSSSGHLFQDRFRSEIIDSDGYLLRVIRYIHQNPLKASMVSNIYHWKWSSLHEYYGNPILKPNIIDTETILSMFSDNIEHAIELFKIYNEAINEDLHMDNNIKIRLTDRMAEAEIKKLLQGYDVTEIKSLPRNKRNELIGNLKNVEGISLRQISRILGLSANLISRVLKE